MARRTVIAYNKERNSYEVQDRDTGAVSEMRRASEALPPPGPRKASMADDIRALRELVEGRGTPDKDVVIVSGLQRVKKRRACQNKARAAFGAKALKHDEELLRAERTAFGWLIAITATAFALAYAAPGKHVNQEATMMLTPQTHARSVHSLNERSQR